MKKTNYIYPEVSLICVESLNYFATSTSTECNIDLLIGDTQEFEW